MISWKTVRLGEIGTFTRSFGIAKTELMSGGLNAIRYGELYTSHHIKIKTILSFVAPTAIVNSIKVEKGDILFATSGETAEEIGKSAIYLSSEECYAGGDILVFTPLANNNPLFLSYLLNSWVARRKLSRLGQGQSIVHIYKHNLEELTLKLPDTLQQDTIVSVLETWDQYLENLDKKIEIEKNIKKGLMQQIFSKKIRFKDDNGNDYSGRRRFRFDEAFTFLRTNSLSRAELSNKGTIMNIHYGDIHTKLGSNFDAKRDGISYAPSNAPRLSDICQDGDLVIADASEDRTDVGKAVEIINTAGCQIVAGLHTFLCRPQGVAVGFSGYLMQSQNMKRHLWKVATGASVVGISKTELAKSNIILPSLEEQQKIAHCLSVLDEQISHLGDKRNIIGKQRKYLLNNLVTGKMHVPSGSTVHEKGKSNVRRREA